MSTAHIRRVDQDALSLVEATWPRPGWNPARREAYLRVFKRMDPELIWPALQTVLEEWTSDTAPPPGRFMEAHGLQRKAERRTVNVKQEPRFIRVGPPEDNAWIVEQPDGRRISADTYGQAGGSGGPHLRAVE